MNSAKTTFYSIMVLLSIFIITNISIFTKKYLLKTIKNTMQNKEALKCENQFIVDNLGDPVLLLNTHDSIDFANDTFLSLFNNPIMSQLPELDIKEPEEEFLPGQSINEMIKEIFEPRQIKADFRINSLKIFNVYLMTDDQEEQVFSINDILKSYDTHDIASKVFCI